MAWGQVAAMVGGGILKGMGSVKANEQQKGENKRLQWFQQNADALGEPVGAELERGYAPGGWYRQALSAMQVGEAERQRARMEPYRMARALRSGGIRSGAYGDRRGGWVGTLSTAGLTGDLGGVRAGVGYDAALRSRRLNELASVPVQANPYALYGNALQSAGQTWWNQGSTYTPTGGRGYDPGKPIAEDYGYDAGNGTAYG